MDLFIIHPSFRMNVDNRIIKAIARLRQRPQKIAEHMFSVLPRREEREN